MTMLSCESCVVTRNGADVVFTAAVCRARAGSGRGQYRDKYDGYNYSNQTR